MLVFLIDALASQPAIKALLFLFVVLIFLTIFHSLFNFLSEIFVYFSKLVSLFSLSAKCVNVYLD